MADQGISMPSGMGGLTRYFDDYKSNFQLSPMHVVILVVLLIAVEIGLRVF
jgi:preprotein translocase subunit Sec61beta